MALRRHLLRGRHAAAAEVWLPLALWLAVGHWAYRHNILENTLGVFTVLSIYASLRALTGRRSWSLWTLLAGVAMAAALLAKGPVGLFPLVTPVVAWWILYRKETPHRHGADVAGHAQSPQLAIGAPATMFASSAAFAEAPPHWHEASGCGGCWPCNRV